MEDFSSTLVVIYLFYFSLGQKSGPHLAEYQSPVPLLALPLHLWFCFSFSFFIEKILLFIGKTFLETVGVRACLNI